VQTCALPIFSEDQIRSVALFFFYAFLDDKVAFSSSVRVVAWCRKRLSSAEPGELNMPAVIVDLTAKQFFSARKFNSKPQFAMAMESGWQVPARIDLGVWQEFQKAADPDEFLAVIWSKILAFNDAEIASGLGVSLGTVRHRVSRGLRTLGYIKT